MKVVAFIFARGGSKGLPGKNLRRLGDKPLIAWAIEQAFAITTIEKVIVSTDSEEIAAVAREYGADVPFIRPPELAQDDSPEWLSWQHAINYLNRVMNIYPEIMVSVPTTAPLRLPIDIKACLNAYFEGGADIVITTTDAHRSPYFNMIKIRADGQAELVISPGKLIIRRQDAPVVYDMTTVCYVANTNFVMTHNGIFDGRVRAVNIPVERALDIDTLTDFQIAESFLIKRKNQL